MYFDASHTISGLFLRSNRRVAGITPAQIAINFIANKFIKEKA
jgi:hypothetical protein